MDYKCEFERLLNTVDQYVKSNGESTAAKQALLNAHKFYTDSGFVSSNSDDLRYNICCVSCCKFNRPVKNMALYSRPKTRGELLKNLKKGVKCEIVTSYRKRTNIALDGWLQFENKYISYPSGNLGWTIYEAI